MKHKLFIAVAILFFVISCEMMSKPDTNSGTDSPTGSCPMYDSLIESKWQLAHPPGDWTFSPTQYQWFLASSRTEYTTITCDVTYTDDTFTTSNCLIQQDADGTPRLNSTDGTYQYEIQREGRELRIALPNDVVVRLGCKDYRPPGGGLTDNSLTYKEERPSSPLTGTRWQSGVYRDAQPG